MRFDSGHFFHLHLLLDSSFFFIIALHLSRVPDSDLWAGSGIFCLVVKVSLFASLSPDRSVDLKCTLPSIICNITAASHPRPLPCMYISTLLYHTRMAGSHYITN